MESADQFLASANGPTIRNIRVSRVYRIKGSTNEQSSGSGGTPSKKSATSYPQRQITTRSSSVLLDCHHDPLAEIPSPGCSNSSQPLIAKPRPVYMKRRTFEIDPIRSNLISKLFNYIVTASVSISETPAKGSKKNETKKISGEDADELVLWARAVAPNLFWSPFRKYCCKVKDEWVGFEVICEASTITASTFMSLIESSIQPCDSIKYAGRKVHAFQFICKIMSGFILSSDKRKETFVNTVDEAFEMFYTCGFRCITKVMQTTKGFQTGNCDDCANNPCACTKVTALFLEANKALQGLGLMNELAGPRVYTVVRRQMCVRVRENCCGKYEISHLVDLFTWLKNRIMPWIDAIFPKQCAMSAKFHLREKMRIEEEFSIILFEVYGKSIIDEMFSVIIEFPESQPMLDDLRVCMREVNLRTELVTKLKAALERRLLNAGVNTTDVLDAYVATVRALKYVDPTGILVQLVTPPVREYLKHRDETVRVILVSLTEESGDLAEELSRNPSYADSKSRPTLVNWKAWDPDPIDVPKDKHNLRKSDLIQALVSIYGSKTLFIDEYRALLADRLLRMPKPGSITREIKCLELLKLRFGDSDLQKCEVMLKDVSDSQRLNTRFYEDEGAVLADQEVGVTGLVVSAQFWPPFKNETLELPKPISDALEKYTKAFEMIKGNRTLEWQKHIGNVEIELDHLDTTVSLVVTPAQATIIWHFQDKCTWTLADLATATGIPPSSLRQKIGFWISKGVIVHAGDDVYCLHEGFTEGNPATGVAPAKYLEEADADSPMTSTSTQRETELTMFWSYIEGMLTNLESLPLARIHSMLKLFATVECSLEELQKFLDEKVSQNLLVYSSAQYQLPK